MVSKKFVIKNPTGFHIRPAGMLCEAAMNHKAHITFRYGGNGSEANVKSILSILGACIRSGDEIELVCDGEDEADAMEELSAMIENGFGELNGDDGPNDV